MTRLPLVPQRILCVAPNWVGDSLFFLPAVDALRRRFPQARLDLMARPGIASLLKDGGRFDQVKVLASGAGRWSRFGAFWALRRESYDLAVLFPDSFSMALGAFLSGAKIRVGRQGEGRSLFLSPGYRLPARQRQIHVVDEYLELARACGAGAEGERQPQLPPSAQAAEEARQLFDGAGLGKAKVIGLCPTSAYGPSKQWPAEHWVRLARELASKNFEVAFFCAPNELEPVKTMAGLAGAIPVLAPSLPGLAACLAACEAVVANDSGPLHLAAAVGARCLGLYGPVDPKWSAPVSPRADWLYRGLDCSPCHARVCPLGHHDCLQGMEPAQVMSALLELLKR